MIAMFNFFEEFFSCFIVIWEAKRQRKREREGEELQKEREK